MVNKIMSQLTYIIVSLMNFGIALNFFIENLKYHIQYYTV
jgi:hypothetical protein